MDTQSRLRELEIRREKNRRTKARRKMFNRLVLLASLAGLAALFVSYYNVRDYLINRKLIDEGEYITGVVLEKTSSNSNPAKNSVKYHYTVNQKKYVQRSALHGSYYSRLSVGDSCVIVYARTRPAVSKVFIPLAAQNNPYLDK